MANTQTSVPVFTAGQILTAQQQTEINTGIPVFATTVTRDAAFGGAGEKVLAEGQVCYIENTNRIQVYDGAAFANIDTGEWTSYTPVLTASTTNPTLGAGSIALGRFCLIGKTVSYRVKIQFGTSGVNAGSGAYFVSLPTNSQGAFGGVDPLAFVVQVDASASQRFIGLGLNDANNKVFMQMQSNSTGSAPTTDSAPFTFAANDQIFLNGTYEAA